MKVSEHISKLLLICTLFLFATQAGQAQSRAEFGVKGGLNYSTFNNTDNVEYRTGALAGLFATFPVPNSPVDIQPEFLYTQYGANIEDSDGEFKVSYLQIPVLAKFSFGELDASTRPNVFFGPYIGFNVDAELSNPDIAIDAEDYFENTDAGVVVGAGVDVSQFNFALRYTAGLTNVVADEDFEDNQKNGAFALSVGIRF